MNWELWVQPGSGFQLSPQYHMMLPLALSLQAHNMTVKEKTRLFSPGIFLQSDSLVLSNQKLPFLTIIVTQLLPNSSPYVSHYWGLNFISAEIKKKKLEGNCLTIFCQFLSYIKMNQPQAYIGTPPSWTSPPSLPPPTPLVCHRALRWFDTTTMENCTEIL